MTPYRAEFERRVKKVIVANAHQYALRDHADHDLQDCTFSTDVADGTVYGPCRCGATLRATAEWPGYSLGEFFRAVTDDAT